MAESTGGVTETLLEVRVEGDRVWRPPAS